MLSGAHCPNNRFTELPAFRTGSFTSAKVMPYHTDQEVSAIRAIHSAARFLMRLPDSGLYKHSVAECVEAWAAVIRRCLPLGITDFQVDNEPNLQPAWDKAWWTWRWFLSECLQAVRETVSGGYRLGLPPLAYAPSQWGELDMWKRMLTWRDAGDPGGGGLADLCDWAGVNCYWQSDRQMGDRGFGAAFQEVHELTGLPVTITEYGNSLCDKQPAPPPDYIQSEMRRQYPEYIRRLRSFPYIEAAHLFILPPSQGWAGFEPGPDVLRALGVS